MLNPAILKLKRYYVTKVAKTVNKSREMIINLLKDRDYGKRKGCGRP